jgi:hypothetical protein
MANKVAIDEDLATVFHVREIKGERAWIRRKRHA